MAARKSQQLGSTVDDALFADERAIDEEILIAERNAALRTAFALARGKVVVVQDAAHTVLTYEGAPLSNISVSVTKDGRLEQKATLHKGHQEGLRHGFEFVDEMAEQSPLQREVRTPLFMLPKILAGQQ
jgi:hypothetical protein